MNPIVPSLESAVDDNIEHMFGVFRHGVAAAVEILQGGVEFGPATLIRFGDRRAAMADDFSARTVAENDATERPVECAKGCAHCCNQHVLISSTEAFCLALAAPDPATLRETVTVAAARIGILDHAGRFGIACPLLVERSCSLYGQRPQACRTHFSLSRRACAYDKTAPTLVAPKLAGAAIYYAFDYTLLRVADPGPQMVVGELATMLAAALAPDAFYAWGAGDAVFPAQPFRPSTRSGPEQATPYPELLDIMAKRSGADAMLHVVEGVA